MLMHATEYYSVIKTMLLEILMGGGEACGINVKRCPSRSLSGCSEKELGEALPWKLPVRPHCILNNVWVCVG
jgi:hypothetical protein